MSRAMLARKSENLDSASGPSQATTGRLKINKPGDALEREADRAADEVMARRLGSAFGNGRSGKAEWSLSGIGVGAPLQRACSCGGSGKSGGECEECGKKDLQRKETAPAGPGEAPPLVQQVLGTPGTPLDSTTRNFYQQHFGFDFGRVRVHTDSAAGESARQINAVAYTVGDHLVFGSGNFSPQSVAGGRLLAHELVHTVQQAGGGRAAGVIQRQETPESTGPSGVLGKAKYLWQDVKNVVSPSKWSNAKDCLTNLIDPDRSITFDRWIATACARNAGKTLYSREWDAFGHCWIACEGTRQCGGPQTFTLGLGHEVSREWESRTGGAPHDSLTQDLSNQTIGRVGSVKEGTCFSICDDFHKSGHLNLSAPKRTCIDCANQAAGETPCADADKPAGAS
ncbi:MAG: DUF4157 domain-containing protein [Acidobacteriaceae bacterium]